MTEQPVADRDTWKAPDTRVVRTEHVSGRKGACTLRIPLTAGEESFYVRLRGSDGNRNGPGYLGASVDPHGPVPHAPGDGDRGRTPGSARTPCSWTSRVPDLRVPAGHGPIERTGRAEVRWAA